VNQDILIVLALLAGLFLVVAAVVAQRIGRQQRIAQRLRSIRPGAERGATLTPATAALGRVEGLGASIVRGRLLSPSTIEGLEQTLRAAGFRGERALGLFIGAKIMLLLGLPIATVAILYLFDFGDTGLLFGAMVGAVVGLLSPDMIASRLRARYLSRLERSLPDGLDLLVICAESGLALQPAMQRVSDEMGGVSTPVAAEFRLTLHELRVLTDRREALQRMAKRTSVPALQRLAQTLIQSMQYGTPLSQALRMLAQELRQEQLVRFEARAARLPVLLTLPMVLFILPTLFLVVGGPAAVQVMRIW
jgi:tight adherence protein C